MTPGAGPPPRTRRLRAALGAVAAAAAAIVAVVLSTGGDSATTRVGHVLTALDVVPDPGGPDASPRAQIRFAALSPADLRSVGCTRHWYWALKPRADGTASTGNTCIASSTDP
jgi:hypothetical protein